MTKQTMTYYYLFHFQLSTDSGLQDLFFGEVSLHPIITPERLKYCINSLKDKFCSKDYQDKVNLVSFQLVFNDYARTEQEFLYKIDKFEKETQQRRDRERRR